MDSLSDRSSDLRGDTNPYSPAPTQPEDKRNWFRPLAIVPLIGFGYPIWAIASVALTWFMDRVLGMRGAIIHSYSTPLGIVFNVAAFLIMNWLFLLPIGLVLSVFVAPAIRRPRLTIVFPLAYVFLCVSAIAFVLIDPLGLFDYFFD